MSEYQYTNSKGEIRWGARVKRDGIQLQKQNLTTRAEAVRIGKALEKEAIQKALRSKEAGASFGRLVNEWEIAMRDIANPNTLEDNIRVLQIHAPHWANRKVGAITPFEVREVLQQMALNYSNARRRHFVSALNGAIKWGMETGRIPYLPQLPTAGI